MTARITANCLEKRVYGVKEGITSPIQGNDEITNPESRNKTYWEISFAAEISSSIRPHVSMSASC